MRIHYTNGGKTATYNGIVFTMDKRTGYYLSTVNFENGRKRLHRYVWECEHGQAIPDGMDVHHKDGDKSNNEIWNLEVITRSEHRAKHDAMDPSISDFRRKNVIEKALPAANRWHGSEEGIKWHKEQGVKAYAKREPRQYICSWCGSEFHTKHVYSEGDNTFCSNKCKAAFRRDSGVDNEVRRCAICGREYIANKYSKVKYCKQHRRNRG